jgi:hypothetical protein
MRAPERCISVLAMLFKNRDQGSEVRGQGRTKLLFTILFLALLTLSSIINNSYSELLDRVVANVNDEVILFTELQEAVRKAEAAGEEKSEKEILEILIRRTLLFEQAKRFNPFSDAYYQDERETKKLINEYIERRIKAFIHVSFEEIENYYMDNKDSAGEKDLYESWDEIESRLRNEKLASKLDEHISLLRKEAYIRIQLDNMH